MAKFVLKDAVITVGGTAISDHCSSVTIEDSAEEVDVTSFSASAYREFIPGLKDATITLSVFNDDAATGVTTTLYPLYQSGGTTAVVVKATSAATSATNPTWTMNGALYSFSPLGGGVGDAATTDISFRLAGTAGVVRGTA